MPRTLAQHRPLTVRPKWQQSRWKTSYTKAGISTRRMAERLGFGCRILAAGSSVHVLVKRSSLGKRECVPWLRELARGRDRRVLACACGVAHRETSRGNAGEKESAGHRTPGVRMKFPSTAPPPSHSLLQRKPPRDRHQWKPHTAMSNRAPSVPPAAASAETTPSASPCKLGGLAGFAAREQLLGLRKPPRCHRGTVARLRSSLFPPRLPPTDLGIAPHARSNG